MKNVKKVVMRILHTHTGIVLQNTLMKIPDREIAVALMALNEQERSLVFSHISQAKTRRVQQEIRYQFTLDIRPDRYEKIVGKFVSYFEPGKKQFKDKSFIRPMRRKRR
jgi:flagellar motor switch protein FliG